ncbi:MAG: tripartite tricarboxylate transporter substrate binding protein [Hyphomicrobium sp.]|nr:tripartite tricarboxylate transporter substrate binding protein [Hyphomicrobium sp.]ODT20961.1 MAG: ABC transporter substrate-binding protein [Hyphomicrobium sp. SCN 65-11]
MSVSRLASLSRIGLAVVVSALFCGAAAAQSWPTKPITIVQGFPAGSGLDIIARIIQAPLEKELGTTIVFDYKAGAGGNLASEIVAKAAPDGYTFIFGTAGTHGINASLYKKLSFDVESDFTPIAPIVDVPNVITVNPKVVDAKDVKEFIEIIKKQPGKQNYGSSGNGASTHLGFAQFNVAAGIDMVHIPYKGSPAAIQAMLNGETCCQFAQLQTVLGQHKAGTLRLLGMSTSKRVPLLPDIPTIAEAALPGFESVTWYGMLGPKGLDPAIVSKFNAAIKAVLEDKEVVAKLAGIGNAVRYETADQFRATIKKDRAQWAEVVKKSGATVD